MIVIDIKRVLIISFSIATFNVVGQDGIMLPMDEHSNSPGKCASIRLVLAKDDLTLPKIMTVYKPQSDFVATDKVECASVQTSGKIIIDNNTDWPYVFGRQCMRTGYDSLEFDMMMDSGNIVCLRKRRPELLHEDGSFITLKAQRQWECMFSLDRRLWDFPDGIVTSKVVKIRPRFAFGAYNVDGIYYRTIEEVKTCRKKERRFDDRDGELVGDWVDYSTGENTRAETTAKDESN